MTIVYNTVFCDWNSLRVEYKGLHTQKSKYVRWGDICVS